MPVLRKKRKRKSDYLLLGGELVYMILLMAAGIMQPSLLTAVYFLIFIATSSWLACTQTLQHSYFVGRIGLLAFAGIHFILTYAYQFSFFYEALPSNTLPARLLGLVNVVDSPCSDSRTLSFLNLHWTVYVSPLMILALYCHTAIMTRYRLLSLPATYEEASASGHSKAESRRVSTLRKRRRSEGARRLLNEEVPPHNYNSIEDPGGPAPVASAARASLVPDPDGSIVWSVDIPPSNAYSEAPTSRGYRYPLLTLFRLIAKGSYIGTLIIMMAWSITYHSWLTFVLLVGSCILWMTPNSRKNVLRSSPLLVTYAELLLLLQYVYSLKLNDKELPSDVPGISLTDIGIRKYYDGSYQPLATKILYTGMFWLTLWFYLEEKKQQGITIKGEILLLDSFHQPESGRPEVRSSRGDMGGPSLVRNNPWLVFVGHQVSTILAKYWIWIVACMLMVISLGGHTVVIYRIVYMVFFLSFIILFQFSYHTWRKVMKTFWVMVIIYSIFVLLLIYIYQFKGVPDFLQEKLRIRKKLQEDFGLEIYSESGVLLSMLLTPTFFLIITIIQLHYFHQQFLIFSNINYRPVDREITQETIMNDSPRPPASTEITIHPRTPSKLAATSRSSIIHPEDVVVILQNLTITTYLKEAWEAMWRSLEIHVNKIVLFSMICLAFCQANPLHLFYIVFVLVALPMPRFHKFFCHCGALWTAFLLILKMIYQLKFTKEEPFHWETNCTNISKSPFNETIDNLRWIGLEKSDNLVHLCRGYIGIIVILTLQTVTYIRQRILRYQLNLPDPPPGIIFPEVTRSLADKDLVSCAKYLANYCFYKFGLEICFITSLVSISIRMDFFALVATLWIFCLFLLPRYYVNKVWPFYIIYQSFALAVQFILMVGLSPGLCYEYPWSKIWESSTGEPNPMQKWFFLPSYNHPPNAERLIADIFLLIFSYCQLWVFAIERGPNADEYKGGSNKELTYSLSDYCSNPVEDFVVTHKSYLDILKVFVFFSFYWITLAILFMAGARATRISIFALGYVVGCFFFLWSGNEFYLRPRPKLIRMWNSLLVYNLIVVLFKIIFQLVIPTYQKELKANWWIVQLVNNNAEVSDSAEKVTEQALIWDAVCFAFLLFQRRIFCSNYFQYVVMELKAQQILASRGAELINQRQAKIIQEQRQKEKDNMEKIKKKMDKIRDQQKAGRYVEPKDHYEAIRSGDYYLFEEVHAADLETLDYGHTPTEDHEVKQKGINALISQTMKGTYNPWQEPSKIDSVSEGEDVGESSRLSPILSVDRTLSQDTTSSTHQPPDQPPATSSPLPSRKSTEHTAMAEVPLTPESPHFAPDPPFKEAGADEATITEAPATFCSKFRGCLLFVRDVLNSIFISCTDKLNRISKDYRYVAERLTFEKMLLKQKLRECPALDEAPKVTVPHHRAMLAGDSHNGTVSRTSSQIRLDKILESVARDVDQIEEESKEFKKQQPAFIKLIIAMWYALISQSEILCFLVIIIYQINSASVLSLPLPLLAFLWGTLTVPRPTKLFWITIITYTECIVISKYLFQFNFWPWNKEDNICAQPTDPYKCPPLIIGVSKDNYRDLTIYDLMLLLAVFFHRFMLKSFGLWRNSDNITSEEYDALVGEKKPEGVPEDEALDSSVRSKASSKQIDVKGDCVDEEEFDDESSDVESKFVEAKFKEILASYITPIKQFFCNLLYSKDRLTTDVYAYMFFCDFINFLILVFGYNSFGMSANGSVKAYIQENRIPVPFLAMLLAQFATIVIDRALYLRKNILGKLIFQMVMVVLIHIWMFFLLPYFTHKPFYENSPPQLWYMIKSVYFLLSAYQIRMGYPLRILGNFFCKKYNYLNLVLFKLYKFIPFLWELRCLMDWIWTNTSLAVSNWFKMEDIFSHIFVQKCFRRAEEEYPFPRGTPRPPLAKYGIGGTMLIFLILIVWFPLVFFALGNTVGRPNPPTSVELEVTLEGFQPLFTASAQADSFHKITNAEWSAFNSKLRPQTAAINFLISYEKTDVTIVPFGKNSLSTWSISPPSREMLVKQLTSPPPKEGIKLTATVTFIRNPEDASLKNAVVKYENPLLITNETFLRQLGEMINGNSSFEITTLYQGLLPLFLEVGDKSSVQIPPDMPESMRFVNLSLQSDNATMSQWWQLFDANCTKQKDEFYYIFNLHNQCDESIYFIAFNKKLFPAELGLLTNSGIIGLYTTFVLVLSRVIRSMFFGAYKTIMFDEMPNVDRVLELCLDIYLVRENQELALEEDLFAKLIFLYRSPETLIKWTRPEEPSPHEHED